MWRDITDEIYKSRNLIEVLEGGRRVAGGRIYKSRNLIEVLESGNGFVER